MSNDTTVGEKTEPKILDNEVRWSGVTFQVAQIEHTPSADHHRCGRPLRIVEVVIKPDSDKSMRSILDLFETGRPGTLETSVLIMEAQAIKWMFTHTTTNISASFLEVACPPTYAADLVRGWVACEFGESMLLTLSTLDFAILGVLLKVGHRRSVSLGMLTSWLPIDVEEDVVLGALLALDAKNLAMRVTHDDPPVEMWRIADVND